MKFYFFIFYNPIPHGSFLDVLVPDDATHVLREMKLLRTNFVNKERSLWDRENFEDRPCVPKQ